MAEPGVGSPTVMNSAMSAGHEHRGDHRRMATLPSSLSRVVALSQCHALPYHCLRRHPFVSLIGWRRCVECARVYPCHINDEQVGVTVPIAIVTPPREPYESIDAPSAAAGEVRLFRHQVGGRCPLLANHRGTILKPALPREFGNPCARLFGDGCRVAFYANMDRDFPALRPFVPLYHGTLDMPSSLFPAAMGEATKSEGAEWGRQAGCEERINKMIEKSPLIRCIVLEDLSYGFHRPCILDLKIGTRQHGPGAPPIKIASKTAKCASTTSGSLGLRMCGMQVFRHRLDKYIFHDKYYGRTLTTTTFPMMLREYFDDGTGRLRAELMQPLLARLRAFRAVMCRQTQFRFYSCSLFLIHEGAFPAGSTTPLSLLTLPSPPTPSSPSPASSALAAALAALPPEAARTLIEPAPAPLPIVGPSGVPESPSPSAAGAAAVVPSPRTPATPGGSDPVATPVDPRLRCDIRLLDFAQTGRPSEEGGDDNADLDHGLLLGVDSLISLLSAMLHEHTAAAAAAASVATMPPLAKVASGSGLSTLTVPTATSPLVSLSHHHRRVSSTSFALPPSPPSPLGGAAPAAAAAAGGSGSPSGGSPLFRSAFPAPSPPGTPPLSLAGMTPNTAAVPALPGTALGGGVAAAGATGGGGGTAPAGVRRVASGTGLSSRATVTAAAPALATIPQRAPPTHSALDESKIATATAAF